MFGHRRPHMRWGEYHRRGPGAVPPVPASYSLDPALVVWAGSGGTTSCCWDRPPEPEATVGHDPNCIIDPHGNTGHVCCDRQGDPVADGQPCAWSARMMELWEYEAAHPSLTGSIVRRPTNG